MQIHKIRALNEYQHLVEKYADELSGLSAKEVELTARFKQAGEFY